MALSFKPSIEMRAQSELLPNIAKLPERDRDFARSLCDQAKIRGLSPKQVPHVERLIAKAKGEEVKGPSAGDMGALLALFDKAATKINPKIAIEIDGIKLNLSLASPAAKVPGSVTVCVGNVWCGRVLRDGEIQLGFEGRERPGLVDALRKFAQDPAGHAKAFADKVAQERSEASGKEEVGVCCFCSQDLTDPRSVLAGYGPICASNYGLPWGKESAS